VRTDRTIQCVHGLRACQTPRLIITKRSQFLVVLVQSVHSRAVAKDEAAGTIGCSCRGGGRLFVPEITVAGFPDRTSHGRVIHIALDSNVPPFMPSDTIADKGVVSGEGRSRRQRELMTCRSLIRLHAATGINQGGPRGEQQLDRRPDAVVRRR
jgi:hypothetical protein